MTPAIIAFDEGQRSAFDELSGAMPAVINMLAEGSPEQRPRVLRVRPGIRAWSDFPATPPIAAPVVAMALFRDVILYVTDDGLGTATSRKVGVWLSPGSAMSASASDEAKCVAGKDFISLVAGRNFAFAVGGGAPQVINNGFISSRLGGNPPIARDVVLIAQRVVLANADASGILSWSGIGDTEVAIWDTAVEFREAEARPDELVALEESSREIFAIGSRTTQVFYPDENETFVPGPAAELGTLAHRSVFRYDNIIHMLDHHGRLVLTDGRSSSPTVLSDKGIAETIARFAVKNDCWSFRCHIGNHDLLISVFPTEGRTFAWDMFAQTWSEFRSWKDDRWVPWIPYSYLHWPEKNLHLVGLADGRIAELTFDAVADDAARLHWQARTGFTSVPARRHTVEARFRFRRGDATGATDAVRISWRDDLGPFEAPEEISLGTAGDADPVARICPAGMPYEQRQWQIEGDAASTTALVSATDLYEEAEF